MTVVYLQIIVAQIYIESRCYIILIYKYYIALMSVVELENGSLCIKIYFMSRRDWKLTRLDITVNEISNMDVFNKMCIAIKPTELWQRN
jgi:hypothetical protein